MKEYASLQISYLRELVGIHTVDTTLKEAFLHYIPPTIHHKALTSKGV